ncbi:MAG: hypothetical protein RLZ12_7 [Bacillota bacterium]|jgi:hypothetical protein
MKLQSKLLCLILSTAGFCFLSSTSKAAEQQALSADTEQVEFPPCEPSNLPPFPNLASHEKRQRSASPTLETPDILRDEPAASSSKKQRLDAEETELPLPFEAPGLPPHARSESKASSKTLSAFSLSCPKELLSTPRSEPRLSLASLGSTVEVTSEADKKYAPGTVLEIKERINLTNSKSALPSSNNNNRRDSVICTLSPGAEVTVIEDFGNGQIKVTTRNRKHNGFLDLQSYTNETLLNQLLSSSNLENFKKGKNLWIVPSTTSLLDGASCTFKQTCTLLRGDLIKATTSVSGKTFLPFRENKEGEWVRVKVIYAGAGKRAICPSKVVRHEGWLNITNLAESLTDAIAVP